MTSQKLFNLEETGASLRRPFNYAQEIMGYDTAIQAFASQVESGLDQIQEARQADDREHPPDRTWASEIGHPCLRHLYFARTAWKERRPISIDLAYRLDEGEEQEDRVVRQLKLAGYEIIDQQQHVEDRDLQVSGRIDGWIKKGKLGPVLTEIKTIAPAFFDGLRTAQDIQGHRKFWIRKYASQLNFYLHATGQPWGLFIIRTWGRRPKAIPFNFSAELFEADAARMARLNDYTDRKETPPPIPWDNDVCQLCPWGHLCGNAPTTDHVELDPAAEALFEMMLELKAAADKYEQLKAELIGTQSKPGRYFGVTANLTKIIIETKTQTRTFYELPPDVEKAIEELKKPYAVKREIKITAVKWADE